jgi:hypothetical protein
MSEHARKIREIDDANYDLLKLSSAYSGELGQLLYNLAVDIQDKIKEARRRIKKIEANQAIGGGLSDG